LIEGLNRDFGTRPGASENIDRSIDTLIPVSLAAGILACAAVTAGRRAHPAGNFARISP
jgi:hypothetical protein